MPILWFVRAECLFMLWGVTSYCTAGQVLPRGRLPAPCGDARLCGPDRDYTSGGPLHAAQAEAVGLPPADTVQEGREAAGPAHARRCEADQVDAPDAGAVSQGRRDQHHLSVSFPARLPADLRVMLAHLDHSDLKELARKADELWALKPYGEVLAVIQ